MDGSTMKMQEMEIWNDVGNIAISFTGKIPEGYKATFERDPLRCWRLVVASDGSVCANIYGLLYDKRSLPDLLKAARESGLLEEARRRARTESNLRTCPDDLLLISGKTKPDIVGFRNAIVEAIRGY